MAFSIPSGIFDIYDDVVRAFIRDLGRTVTLVYQPKLVACPDCVGGGIGDMPGSRYLGGGIMPVPQMVGCLSCNGTGTKEERQTESIDLNIYYSPKEWQNIGVRIEIPDGIIQVRGFIKDLPKAQRAIEMEVHNDVRGYGVFRYSRYGEQIFHGLGRDNFFLGFWKRIL